MRFVRPQVHLVARPELDWGAVWAYLESIDGLAWFDRQTDTDGPDGPDGQALVEFGGRLCYRSWEPGLNPNVTRIREDSTAYLENILAVKHGSVIEHASYSFVFQDVSRVFTHELVRHRAGAAYSQESMRFVRLTDLPFWLPDWAQADEKLAERAAEVLATLEGFQTWMAEHFGLDAEGVPFHEKKAKTSFMRRFAPDGVATSILATFNVRSLRWLIEARTDPAAEEEIRLVFDRVAEIMKEEAPALFGDFERKETDGQWVPRHSKV